MYEMLVGYPPFYSDEPMSTCRKVIVIPFCMLYSCVVQFPCCFSVTYGFYFIPALLQIVNWRTHLKFPEEAKLSLEAKDLICKLLCNVEQRLGTRGADEIKVFFVASNMRF